MSYIHHVEIDTNPNDANVHICWMGTFLGDERDIYVFSHLTPYLDKEKKNALYKLRIRQSNRNV